MTAELDRHEAAEALGVSLAGLRERAGNPSCPLGPGVKRGRRVYWSRDAIEATLKWQAIGASGRKVRTANAATTAVKTVKSAKVSKTSKAAKKKSDRDMSAAEAKAPKAKKAKSVKADAPKPVETAAAATQTLDATKKASAKLNGKAAEEKSAAKTEQAPKSEADAAAKSAPFGPAVAALDPISIWLEMCQNAANLFQSSCDPRKSLLLMNPFAPFAAYASFAAPMMRSAPTSWSGLGVWGSPNAPVQAPRARNKTVKTVDPAKAQEEARKLHACGNAFVTRH
ncbi:MAG: hypothetical protein MRY74_01200 [Neomegalonema sp.]|nr:hypothetical protein [Neomegalonema sp.]